MLAPRIITALIFGIFIGACILLLPTVAAVGILVPLWLAGTWEWGGFASWTTRAKIVYVASFACLMLLAPWAPQPELVAASLFVALVWWAAALLAVLSYPHAISVRAVALAGFLTLLPPWYIISYLHGTEPLGRQLTLTVLLIVWSADVGAYWVGSRFGRVKLAPRVSPGKTWEGVTGGALLAAAVAWIASMLLALPAATLVGLGLATALASVVGDLTVSMFKRNAGLKDSGALLPGHGGVMDRIDSLAAAVPVFALGLKLTGLV